MSDYGYFVALADRIGALEDRVNRVQMAFIKDMETLSSRIQTLEASKPQPSITETGRILVDPDEYARLERVEKVASELCRPGSVWMTGDLQLLANRLHEALQR